ncbi:MAG: ATP-binding protein [Gammaproteobacteria bacterium]|nr:ATP-binding protein [Gammaproteobacteria bacterium]
MKENRLVIIDRKTDHINGFIEKLGVLGFDVLSVNEGIKNAEESFVEKKPDLILLNPDLNSIKNDVAFSEYVRIKYEIPVVFISDNKDHDYLNDALKVNVDGYLHTISSLEDINATIIVAIKNGKIKNNQNHKIQEINNKASHLAEVNIRMALLVDAYQRIRNAENRLYQDQNIKLFYETILNDLAALTDSNYGALVIREGEEITDFYFHGISKEDMKKIGDFPIGQGVLNDIYEGNKVVRIDDVTLRENSLGYPEGHPLMRTLMGVNLRVNNNRVGAIYLAHKKENKEYTDKDEMLFRMFVVELEHVLERNYLVNSLKNERQALKEEKETQKTLVTRIDEMQDQLTQSDKMASIGQLAAGVAHEINNPIGYVSSNLSMLQKYVNNLIEMVNVYSNLENVVPKDSRELSEVEECKNKYDLEYTKKDVVELLEESHEGIDRVRKIVQDLKDFSHVDEAEWQWADLNKGITSTLNIVNNEIKYKAEVIKELGDIPEIECIASQLNQVFMNLLVNAAHAIEDNGIIKIVTRLYDETHVIVEISDTGSGIEDKDIKNIFNPFFTTKPVGKGTGLGLSLTYSIIQKHQGNIEVTSKLGEGTKFTIRIPVKQPAQIQNPTDIDDQNINMAV